MVRGLFACLVVAAASLAASTQAPVASRAMALTFDDLPFMAAGQPYFPAATRTTADLLKVLRQHRAPAMSGEGDPEVPAWVMELYRS